MTVEEIAKATVAANRAGDFDAAGRLWSPDIVSLEPGADHFARCEGRAAVEAKGASWSENHEVHSVEVEGPWINGDQFTVRYTMTLTPKGGERFIMDEIGLYTVKDGQIVEERFFYGS